MEKSNYYMVFFDYKNNFDKQEKIVENTIDRLFNFYYKNRSLRISKHVILIKPLIGVNEPHIRLVIDNAISEQYQNLSIEKVGINWFIVPVDQEYLDNNIGGLDNELEYLRTK